MSDVLLTEWETTAGRHPWELLASASAGTGDSVGASNAAILARRKTLFGSAMGLLADCPSCREWVEFAAPFGLFDPVPQANGEFLWHDWRIEFRLPTVADLMLARSARDPRGALVERTLVRATLHGEPALLTSDVLAAWEAHLDEIDPLAVIEFSLNCEACGHAWSAFFEPAREYSRELEVAARRLLSEVDALARAYGWDEKTTLGLSPARRRMYLEMVGA